MGKGIARRLPWLGGTLQGLVRQNALNAYDNGANEAEFKEAKRQYLSGLLGFLDCYQGGLQPVISMMCL